MKHTIFLVILFYCTGAFAEPLTGDEILKKVDLNMSADSRVFISKMIIHGRRGDRTVVSKTWTRGMEKSFTEHLSPPREKGVKMLKLKDRLWTYSPSTDRTILIAGHMLRQSFMGSDLSYEDFMEDPELHKMYTAVIEGEEEITDRPCWVLGLTATKKDVAYHFRRLWVDKERHIPLKEERRAKSGKLLKTTVIKKVMKVDERWAAKHVIFKDALVKGEGTEFIMESIEFDVSISEHIFSKAALRK